MATSEGERFSHFPISIFLFLFATEDGAEEHKQAIQPSPEQTAEIGLQTSSTAKVLSELIQFDSENTESILSLLDCRFLAGDRELFSNLRGQLIPEVMARESQVLAERLAEMTRTRHRKFANTVFHLEPNVKDGPGGYQDYVMARWLAAMSAMEKQHGWPDPDTCFSPAVQNDDGLGA